jgi:hypothetical protein
MPLTGIIVSVTTGSLSGIVLVVQVKTGSLVPVEIPEGGTPKWLDDPVLPDFDGYLPHRTVQDAPLEGEPVPGLRADFYRRDEDGRVASVGRYSYGEREFLLAWGFADEPHCRRNAVRAPDGAWHPAVDGCPEVELIRDGQTVVGLAVRAASGAWERA